MSQNAPARHGKKRDRLSLSLAWGSLLVIGLPILACGTVIYLSSTGHLKLFSFYSHSSLIATGPSRVDLSASSGMLYAQNQRSTFVIQPQDGTVLHQFTQTMVAADEHYFFALTGSNDNHSLKLLALRLKDGKQVWQHQLLGLLEGIAVANGVVYCATNKTLLALNASTGALLWQQAIPGIAYHGIQIVNGVIYLWGPQSIQAMLASTGAPLWQRMAYQNIDSLVVQGNTVYVVTNGSVYALQEATGNERWAMPDTGNPDALVGAANGITYLHVYDALEAVNDTNGAVLWRQALGSFVDTGEDSTAANQLKATLADGILYGAVNNLLVAFRASDGAFLWKYAGNQATRGQFYLLGTQNGAVYFQEPGQISAFRGTNGQLLWKAPVTTRYPAGYPDSPALLDGPAIYIATGLISVVTPHPGNQGPPDSCRFTLSLFALSALDGTPLWGHSEQYHCS